MIQNGYYDENNYEWIKTIIQADIGTSVMSIGAWAFYYCTSLESVTIGAGVSSI